MGSSSSRRSGWQQQPAQGHPTALAARQGRDVGVARGEPERVHGDVEGPLEVPCAGRIDLVLEISLLGQQLVEVGVRLPHGCAHGIEPADQGFGLGHPVGDVPEHVLGGIELWLLGQVSDGEAGREPGLAGEAVVLAGHDLQEGGLP